MCRCIQGLCRSTRLTPNRTELNFESQSSPGGVPVERVTGAGRGPGVVVSPGRGHQPRRGACTTEPTWGHLEGQVPGPGHRPPGLSVQGCTGCIWSFWPASFPQRTQRRNAHALHQA